MLGAAAIVTAREGQQRRVNGGERTEGGWNLGRDGEEWEQIRRRWGGGKLECHKLTGG